jgi:transposase-like protein
MRRDGRSLAPSRAHIRVEADGVNNRSSRHTGGQRLTRPMLGFGSFRTARRTLAGVEAMAMLAKGQVRAVPVNDMPAQRAFVAGLFGVAT